MLLAPFRDISQHNIINLFSYYGTYPAPPGMLVKVKTDYFDQGDETLALSNLSSTPNTFSASFSVVGQVEMAVSHEDMPFGMLLKHVREVDENGTPLLFEPQLLAERDSVLPQQAVPILTKGIVRINDIDTTNRGFGGGYPVAGAAAYLGSNGRVATDGVVRIGTFLTKTEANTAASYCILRLNIN